MTYRERREAKLEKRLEWAASREQKEAAAAERFHDLISILRAALCEALEELSHSCPDKEEYSSREEYLAALDRSIDVIAHVRAAILSADATGEENGR